MLFNSAWQSTRGADPGTLSHQVSQVTERIFDETEKIQTNSSETTDGLESISDLVSQLHQSVAVVSTVISQQSQATLEITPNMQLESISVHEIQSGSTEMSERLARTTQNTQTVISEISAKLG